MAYNLPNELSPGASFRQNINHGTDFYNMLVQHAMQKAQDRRMEEQNARAEKTLPYTLKHMTGVESRANSANSRNAQARTEAHQKYLNEQDPDYAAKRFMHEMQIMGNMVSDNGGAQNAQEPSPQQFNALREMVQSRGMPQGQGAMMQHPEEQQQPEMMGSQEQQPSAPRQQGIDWNNLNPLQKMWAAKHGFKIPGAETLHGPARDAQDLEKLRKTAGENSEVYQNAKADYDAKIDAKKDLRDLRARTRAGLKAGEKEFFDDNGIPLGKEIPLTAKERDSEEGNILFNELYPVVYKGASPFSGEGSIDRLDKAFSHYKTDKKARKLVDGLLLSDKAMAATVVNEASTLKSGHTNQTYGRLRESLEAQDIPNIIKKLYKQYHLPASAQLKAAMSYQKLLSDARKKARKSTPASQKLYYNPEMQAQNEANNESGTSSEKANDKKTINGKQYEKIDGDWYETE